MQGGNTVYVTAIIQLDNPVTPLLYPALLYHSTIYSLLYSIIVPLSINLSLFQVSPHNVPCGER